MVKAGSGQGRPGRMLLARALRTSLAAGCVAFLLSGCSSVFPPVVRLYEQHSVNPSDLVIVSNPERLTVTSVDSYHASKDMRFGKGKVVRRIELLPGKHVIKVVKEVPKSVFYDAAYSPLKNFRIQEVTLTFEGKAGESFVMGEDVVLKPGYKWTPWIKAVGSR
ncbi:MAG: hypothetical protein K8T26_07725 [Lentisphaerae bacterium]|nr:hypothetical protein [Lentisphaerota bacterium]